VLWVVAVEVAGLNVLGFAAADVGVDVDDLAVLELTAVAGLLVEVTSVNLDVDKL